MSFRKSTQKFSYRNIVYRIVLTSSIVAVVQSFKLIGIAAIGGLENWRKGEKWKGNRWLDAKTVRNSMRVVPTSIISINNQIGKPNTNSTTTRPTLTSVQIPDPRGISWQRQADNVGDFTN